MISFTAGNSLFQSLSQNTTTANSTLYGQLANVEHRYLLLKYFNNEGQFQVRTIGSSTLVLTASPAIAAVSATLTVAWQFPTCQTTITFSDGETRYATLTNGSTSVTWQVGLTGTSFGLTAVIAAAATSATLSTAWAYSTQTTTSSFSDGTTKSITYTAGSTAITWAGGLSQGVSASVATSVITTSVSAGGVQFYPLPPNYSKLKDVTITIGNLMWTLNEVNSREAWDRLNVFPYFADIPNNYFIYPGGDRGPLLGIWPIPSTTGNVISFNYKFRVPDLSLDDYSTGTVAVTNGGLTITGSGTSWRVTTNPQLESRWIQINSNATAANSGDSEWYQCRSVDSATQITLFQPYQGTSVTAGTFTLGQMPLIAEDFQDLLPWRALVYYFSSIVDNPKKAAEFQELYDQKMALLNEYSSSNTINVNLSPRGMGKNPNIFSQNFGSTP